MIKFKFFIALFIFVSTLQSNAQNEQSKLRLAIALSPQMSWLSSDHDNISSGGNRFGYNMGIIINNFFAPNYAFNTGLTINTTGGSLKMADSTENINLKYIEIPLGLHLRSNEFRRVCYYGQFGLGLQMNIKAMNGEDKSISSDINFFDLSYHFGGGIEYSLGGSTYIMAGIQFNNGITDITDFKDYDDKTVLNRLVFQLGLIF